ncbi:MAG TPA: contractile injection system tape measure protein, partial [Burkholderiales bacterium]
MTASAVHRVRRQTWRVRVGSAPAAFAARARLSAEAEDLLPAFGRAFDAWAPGEAVLRIPRLELSLKVRSLDEIAAKLDEALRRAAPVPAAHAEGPRPAAADALRVLLHYLGTGQLEWHAAHVEPAAAAAALRDTLLDALPAAVRAAPSGAIAFEA